jgi:hypothetical protein
MSALLVLAARHMPTEGHRAAALDRAHDLHLVEADVPSIGATPRRPMVAEYIYCLLCQSLFGGYSRLNMIPSWSEWIERAAVLASVKERPGSVGASRTVRVPAVLDSRSTRRRRASISESFNGYVDVPVLTEIYAAICAPFQDWPSRNTALRITMSFRMTAVTTYLNG